MSSAVSHPNANATRLPTETAFLARASPTCLLHIQIEYDVLLIMQVVRVLPVPVGAE